MCYILYNILECIILGASNSALFGTNLFLYPTDQKSDRRSAGRDDLKLSKVIEDDLKFPL